MRIRSIYGIHLSRCYGRSLGVDPLLPPKKCIYNCIYCPMGKTIVHIAEPGPLVTPSTILSGLESFEKINGCVYDAVYIWGMGDPLLNHYTPVIVKALRKHVRSMGCGGRIIVRTTGYLLAEVWARPILLYVDEVVIPIDAGPELRRIINDPLRGHTLSRLAGITRGLPVKYRKKIVVEVNLLRSGAGSNAEPMIVEELIAYVKSAGVSRIYLKPINRPGPDPGLKPVKGRMIDRVRDMFLEEDLDPVVCRSRPSGEVALADNSEEAIFNHVLRKPLSTIEITRIYGEEGLVNAERLAEAGLLEKITWAGEVFFKARRTIDSYNT